MVLDRIAQVVLIVFGALLLALLVLGLAISCRPLGADPAATATALAASATPLVGTQVPAGPSPTVPSITLAPSPTPTGPATAYPGATATPTPTTDPGAVITPGATSDPGTITDPGATTAPGATAVAPIATVYVPGATVGHVVSRGEWLMQIARCYGVAYNTLLAANPMPYPNYILPGLRLTVPNIGSQGTIVGAPCVVSYTVAAGDTWQSLAQRHATTTAILQRANPGALVAGRAIWVPRVP